MSVALYAPIKPPDHPIPSGDRAIVRDTFAALERAGLAPRLASRFIAYSKRGEGLAARRREASAEAARVAEALRRDPPGLWLTYHPYCKAPDWIGPAVAGALGIPYVTLEAARTGQAGFEAWRAEAQAGIVEADLHLVLKPTDERMLREIGVPPDRIARIEPFLDVDALDAAEGSFERPADGPVVLVAAMMRPGKKLANFEIAARVLREALERTPARIIVAGDGPASPQVREAFGWADPERIRFTGLLERGELLAAMEAADVFLWPGQREPIGMTYLEAASRRLPAVAFADMGVPLVVENGVTGLLAPADDERALAERLVRMLAEPELRRALGEGARARLVERHGLHAAARTFGEALRPLLR